MGPGEIFQQYWWLIFPVFGMAMAVLGLQQSGKQTRDLLSLLKTYAEQGKEPPPELVRAIAERTRDTESSTSGAGRWWTAVTFLALAAGFGVAFWWVRAEDWAFAFLMITVIFGILAIGSLLIALFTRPKA